MPLSLPMSHRLLATLVAALWGLNFPAIAATLEHFPPLFAVALRFVVLAVPTLLWIPRPQVPLRLLIGYGVGFGVMQFAFLYLGMTTGMPAGLASLVLQASAPFTVLLAAAFLRQGLSRRRVAGVVLASGGLAVVGFQRAESAALLPFVLVLVGALGWAVGNVCSAQARAPKPLHLVLWMSVVPPVPMLALAWVVEGPDRITTSLTSAGPTLVPALLGMAYTIVLGTLVGSGIWTWLMACHPSGVIAPFSMLVPVVGMSAAWLVRGETVTVSELIGAVLVVTGVLIASIAPRASREARRSRQRLSGARSPRTRDRTVLGSR